MRRFYFPLRSSVELFPEPTSVEAGTRAKEAAVLYDEVFFEFGLLTASVGDSGSFQMWRPPHEVTTEELEASRTLAEPGQNFKLAVGQELAPGVPAPPEAMRTVIDAELQRAYAAEWHTSAIDELAELDVSWARYGSLSDKDMAPLAEPIRSTKYTLEQAGKEAGMPPFQAAFASDALAQDAVVAARIGAAFSVTSLFEPMLEALDLDRDRAGRTALTFAVPNLGQLPWEVVAEYREHSGSQDARGKLRELEQRALAAEPDDPLAFATQVSQSITADLFAVIDDLRGSPAKQLGAEAAKTAVSFLPIVGPFIGSTASIAEAVAGYLDERHAWYAALMKLREYRPD